MSTTGNPAGWRPAGASEIAQASTLSDFKANSGAVNLQERTAAQELVRPHRLDALFQASREGSIVLLIIRGRRSCYPVAKPQAPLVIWCDDRHGLGPEAFSRFPLDSLLSLQARAFIADWVRMPAIKDTIAEVTSRHGFLIVTTTAGLVEQWRATLSAAVLHRVSIVGSAS
jgi:hypothetical protein